MHKTIHENEPKLININNKKKILGYHRNNLCNEYACNILGCTHMPEYYKNKPQDYLFSFEKYVQYNQNNIYSDSYYIKQIKNWLKVIKREQLFIINLQTLYNNITETKLNIESFLNLTLKYDNYMNIPHKNENYVQANITCKIYDRLENYYKQPNNELYEFINDNTNNTNTTSSSSNSNRKPISEPYFPKFISNRKICVE